MDEDRRRRRKVAFIAGIAGLVVAVLAVGGMDLFCPIGRKSCSEKSIH
jgi:hypothetical protein